MPWPSRKGIPNPNGGCHDGSRGTEFVAKGHRISDTMLHATIVIDDETFDQVAARAKARRKSFSWAVREILEVGLETLKAEGSDG